MVTRRLLALALAFLVALAGQGPALAADPIADIPGVPLPGPIATGRLGGTIIDRVYSVDLPAGRVLVASLTGSPGTDFDLYLFDASATTVYETTGLVAKSTGPTSTEVVAYPSPSGGRYYIDLSGFSEVEGDYRLTVQTGSDTTPPRLSLVIAGGAPAISHPDVSVTINALDDLSGVDEIRLSPDGQTWWPWQPYAPQVDWSFTGADGAKSLFVQARDRQGNVSVPARATIVLDRTAPFAVARTPEPNGIISARRPTLSVTFSEPIRPESWMLFGLILQDTTGEVIYGTYGWDPATYTGTFRPNADLRVGGVYVVSLGSIVDLAGNPVSLLGGWTVRPLEAPRITLVATPRSGTPGSAIQLSGTVDVRPGGTFALERLDTGGAWTAVEPVLPDGSGAFSAKQVVQRNATFRVTYSGNAVSTPTVSSAVRVLVRRSVVVSGPAASVRRSAAVGQRVAVTAILGPSAPAVPVTLTLSRYNPVRRAHQVVARLTRLSVNGRASFAWRGLNAGTYSVRLTTPATDQFAAGVSGTYRWTVR